MRIKRTVEGDLGIRYNARTIFGLIGDNVFLAKLRRQFPKMNGAQCNASDQITYLSQNVNHVPGTPLGLNIDIVLAESAVSIAVERHAGTLKQEFTIGGEVMVQNGKNLLPVQNLIGTGGIFKYGLHPERVLKSALFNVETPWSLKPKSPNTFVDRAYMLYGIGLLAEHFPLRALRIAKKYLTPVSLVDEPVLEQQIISEGRRVELEERIR